MNIFQKFELCVPLMTSLTSREKDAVHLAHEHTPPLGSAFFEGQDFEAVAEHWGAQ